MNRKVQILFLSFVITISGIWSPEIASMHVGTFQLPRTIKQTPSLRVYFAGSIIDCITNNDTKQVSFNIPSFQRNTPLYLLVTEHVRWQAEENTIKYLKTDANKPYKLYLITPKDPYAAKATDGAGDYWETQEIALNVEGQIPDNTIIVIFNPSLIEGLEGGNSITLPSLRVYSDVLDRVGSEKQLHTMVEELLLASIDSDSVHVKTHCTVKPYYQLKTVVALTT